MEIVRICPKERLLIKYYMIKDLLLLKILNMMNINVELIHMCIYFLKKKSIGVGIRNKSMSNQELVKDYTKQSTENLKVKNKFAIYRQYLGF